MYLLFYKTDRTPEPCFFEETSNLGKYIVEKLQAIDPVLYANKPGIPTEAIDLKFFPSNMLTQLQATILLSNGKKHLNTDFHIMSIQPYYVYKNLQKTVQTKLFQE